MMFQDLLDIEQDGLKDIYNFIYRLSNNKKVAEKLTEKAFQNCAQKKDTFACVNANPLLIVLKEAWNLFEKNYGFINYYSKCFIQNAVLQLQGELRCAVILRYIQGFSNEDISIVLTKNISEVNSLLAQGRKCLCNNTYPPTKETGDNAKTY